MGTRNLVAVMSGGEYKIAQYGQWDGYPEGQGLGVLQFLRSNGVDKLKANLSRVRFYDVEKDKEFLDAYEKNAPQWSNEPDKRTPEQIRWFNSYITRNLGSTILSNVALSTDSEILLSNSISFAADSLMCEWAYVIDFDKGTFEVYEGFNKTALPEGERFSNLKKRKEDGEYYPVRLVKTFDLNNLPDEKSFLAEFAKPEEEDEEPAPDTKDSAKN